MTVTMHFDWPDFIATVAGNSARAFGGVESLPLQSAPEAGEPCGMTAPTLNQYHDRQYKARRKQRYKAGHMTKRTYADEADRYRVHVAPSSIGDMPLNLISPRIARAFVDGLDAGMATQSRRTIYRIVKKVFSYAIEDGVIAGPNPFDGIRIETRRADKADDHWTFLTATEIEAFEADTTMTAQQRAAILTAIYTGGRLNEVKSLHWQDVDLDQATITWRYGSVPSKHGADFGPPKAGKVVTLPLFPRAVATLRRYVDEVHGGTVPRTGLVFPRPNGTPWALKYCFAWEGRHNHRTGEWVQSIPERVIGRHVRFHDTRHTFCSHLALGTYTDRPCTLLEIKRFARHSSATMSERYAHLSDDHLRGLTRAPTSGDSLPETSPSSPECPDQAARHDRGMSAARVGTVTRLAALAAPLQPPHDPADPVALAARLRAARDALDAALDALAAFDTSARVG